jgi:peptide/nickel transport system substrate-binding protein
MTTKSWIPAYSSAGFTRRRFLKGAMAGAGAVALIACGGGGGGSDLQDAGNPREPGSVWFAKNNWRLADESKEAVKGGIYRGSRNGILNAHYDTITQGQAQADFAHHTHEMYMSRNRGPGVDPSSTSASQPVGALAESWEISPDGLSVTYNMRPNVKWHPIAPVNGRTMDIDDWKTTHERYAEKGEYRAELAIIDKVEYPDARRMVWRLKAPNAALNERIYSPMFIYSIMPKELNANPGLAEVTCVGTGYKILDKNEPAITLEYRKHAAYWGGEPFIDRWHTPIIPEYSNRYAQFVRGNIMDFTPTAKDVLLLAKDAPDTVIVAQDIPDDNVTRMRFGSMSPAQQAWKDPRVRVAVRRSIDFKKIGEFLANQQQLEGAGIAIDVSPMTHLNHDPGFWLNPEAGELGALSGNYIYDPAEAKKLTAAAGFSQPIEMRFFVLPAEGIVPETEQLVMDSLAAAGAFKLNPHFAQSETEQREYRTAGTTVDGLIAQSGSTGEADRFIFRDYHSQGNMPRGPQAFPDQRLDDLAVKQRSELDVEKRLQLLKDFQMLTAELMPTIPGRHLFTTLAFRWPWLHNLAYGSTGSPPQGRPVAGGHLQWLSPDMPDRDRRI